MSGHAPGPWKWEERKFNAGWTSTVLVRDALHSAETRNPILGIASAACSWKPRDADARLIAAAPDLLMACLAMLGTWGGQDEDAIIKARDMARDAISKAIDEEHP